MHAIGTVADNRVRDYVITIQANTRPSLLINCCTFTENCFGPNFPLSFTLHIVLQKEGEEELRRGGNSQKPALTVSRRSGRVVNHAPLLSYGRPWPSSASCAASASLSPDRAHTTTTQHRPGHFILDVKHNSLLWHVQYSLAIVVNIIAEVQRLIKWWQPTI